MYNRYKLNKYITKSMNWLSKFKNEVVENSAIESAKKDGNIDYTEILRDMKILKSIDVILGEIVKIMTLLDKPREEIEEECEKEDMSPLDVIRRDFIRG